MTDGAAGSIQPGIFFRRGEQPAACWRLLLLDFAAATRPPEAHAALSRIAQLLAALPRGDVRELAGQPDAGVRATRETFGDLTCLWAFGRRLFDGERHEPPLTAAPRPEFLAYLPALGDPFPALPWAEAPGPSAEADVAIQLTGAYPATVNRAAVEVWKLIADEGLPLRAVVSFDGFARPDGRGWLEFHDGVSNLESSQRSLALAARGDPAWMEGGTYMAFLRCRVDLRAWGALERSDQELIVGRDKLTGSPLVATERDAAGRARPVAAPPLPAEPTDAQLADHHDPPQAGDPLIEASHLHRANQSRASPHATAAWRMFRQGYDFLESIGPGGPLLGLNFVSFQADLAALQHVLHLPGWLADVNFGGPARPGPGDPPSPALLSLIAGAVFAVPPVAEPFPGAELFG